MKSLGTHVRTHCQIRLLGGPKLQIRVDPSAIFSAELRRVLSHLLRKNAKFIIYLVVALSARPQSGYFTSASSAIQHFNSLLTAAFRRLLGRYEMREDFCPPSSSILLYILCFVCLLVVSFLGFLVLSLCWRDAYAIVVREFSARRCALLCVFSKYFLE